MKSSLLSFLPVVALVLAVPAERPLGAQDPAPVSSFAERGPRFLYSPGPTPVRLDAARTPALRRRVSLKLRQVTLEHALRAISAQAELKLFYSRTVVPLDRRVSLDANDITVAAALTEVLLDANVDVLFSMSGQAALVKRVTDVLPATGTIAGRVADSTTNEGIARVTVSIVGARNSTTTGADGAYRLAGVPAGMHTVTARRLGYRAQTLPVTVADDETASLDFILAHAPTQLSEIVVTPTGDRRRLEVGNVIGTIKADSIVQTTLIRNISDLLQARTPGVVVQNQSGMVGSPSKVRIRGLNSVYLNNDPIVIIDGVRVFAAGPRPGQSQTNTGSEDVVAARSTIGSFSNVISSGVTTRTPSRIDDLDPSTIESIDVLRGPSAASLYGTEAANGVVVIKTKRGGLGRMRFSVMADNGWSYIPGDLPLTWFGWGRMANGTPISTCRLAADVLTRPNVADGTCVQDSVTAFNPQNHPYMTTLGTGSTRNVTSSLSGGTAQVQQFLSFRAADNVGIAKMAEVERNRYRNAGVAVAPWMERPNTENTFNGSSRTSIRARSDLELSFTLGAVYRDVAANSAGSYQSPPTQYFTDISSLADTLQYLSAIGQRTKVTTLAKRGFSSANLNYTPRPWLALRGTFGGDYTLRTDESLMREQECQFVTLLCTSGHSNMRAETFVTSMDIGATFSFTPLPWMKTRTSLGEQYANTKFQSLYAGNIFGTNLAFGSELLSPTPIPSTAGGGLFEVTQARDEGATAGWYVEQMVALRDRLFVTAAFRQDLASAFGSEVNAKAPVYPKLSASWLASEESFMPRIPTVTSLRLRLAYGHSGQQAGQGAVQNNFVQTSTWIQGIRTPGVLLSQLGNPALKPERTKEWEGGFDLSLFGGDRVLIEGTMYHKISDDAIFPTQLPGSFGIAGGADIIGNLSQAVNVGKVENRGVELLINGKILDTRTFGWDATIIATRNRNKLVHRAAGSSLSGNSFRQGFPLYSYIGERIVAFEDLDGDGILEFDELVTGDTTLLGVPYPMSELTYGSTFTFLGGALRLSANVNQVNGQTVNHSKATRGRYDRTASLAEQAAAIRIYNGYQGLFLPANSVRLSELSATYNVPARLARRFVRANSAAVTFAGRNLGLWTNYAGFDPNINGNSSTQGSEEKLEDGGNFNVLPQPRNWMVRVNLGF